MKKQDTKTDTYSYRGWLISDNFMKRCFAVLGYSMVGSLIVYGAILAVLLVFGLIFGMIALLASLA
ncbi:MAG: hypothetical protein ABH879_04265 [archaeon]